MGRAIGVAIAVMEYLVIYEQGPTSWGAYVPDLPDNPM
jgi:hypothetical protein